MTPDRSLDDTNEAVEAAQLAGIEADLSELSADVDAWIHERFLAPSTESPASDAPELDVADVKGLIAWLQQWHVHFDRYRQGAQQMEEAGRPAVAQRLAAVREEIDRSIENFAQLAQSLPNPYRD